MRYSNNMSTRNVTQLDPEELTEWRALNETKNAAWDALYAAADNAGIWMGGDWGEVKFNCCELPELYALQKISQTIAEWQRVHNLYWNYS
jgi:hypothetical protein